MHETYESQFKKNTDKYKLFEGWDKAQINSDVVDYNMILKRMKYNDHNSFHIGCLLYENYTNAKIQHELFNNVCTYFKEWLNNKVDEYRNNNMICGANKLLNENLKALWEEKQKAQDEEENWCQWKPSTDYYCYISKIKKFIYDKNYRENIIRYYMQRLHPFRNRQDFSLDFNTIRLMYTICMG
ncbi:variable surface protein [Plasmodium gonderi]|uniref:Variable surface protein n=1 Tax=Plasmodium gonderi TaxID=77519 RepID=A0A1Y1JQ43_PLAGO|nr:variable surface protein [Plasmodium gonderi]GAW84601.1 variable surface protein [Plasmodium gonderi]